MIGERPKIRAIIVEDEPLGRDRIRMLLSPRDDVELVAECENGRSAVQAIRQFDPDLVFLDVQMPVLDGFGVVREIGPEAMPPVIFVTAYDEYAVQAFEVHALDYLLKPYRPNRFSEAVDRVVGMIREGRRRSLSGLAKTVSDRPRYLERILVKGSRKAHFIRVSQIEWIEAAGNYLRLHVDGKSHLIRQTMNNLERQLDPDGFVRIHRSAIVNLSNVKELQRNETGEFEVVLDSGERLKLSRGYRRELDRFDPFTAGFAR